MVVNDVWASAIQGVGLRVGSSAKIGENVPKEFGAI